MVDSIVIFPSTHSHARFLPWTETPGPSILAGPGTRRTDPARSSVAAESSPVHPPFRATRHPSGSPIVFPSRSHAARGARTVVPANGEPSPRKTVTPPAETVLLAYP